MIETLEKLLNQLKALHAQFITNTTGDADKQKQALDDVIEQLEAKMANVNLLIAATRDITQLKQTSANNDVFLANALAKLMAVCDLERGFIASLNDNAMRYKVLNNCEHETISVKVDTYMFNIVKLLRAEPRPTYTNNVSLLPTALGQQSMMTVALRVVALIPLIDDGDLCGFVYMDKALQLGHPTQLDPSWLTTIGEIIKDAL